MIALFGGLEEQRQNIEWNMKKTDGMHWASRRFFVVAFSMVVYRLARHRYRPVTLAGF